MLSNIFSMEEMRMKKRPYETPKIFELGTVEELTLTDFAKCGGSADVFSPTQPGGLDCDREYEID